MLVGFKRWRTLAVASIVLACTAEAAPPLTQIQDMIYTADGLPFNGIVEVAWQPFTASDTSVIAGKTLRLTVTNGFLNVSLTPTTTALTPASYSVVYISGGKNQSSETWAVPPSAAPVRIQDIRTASNQMTPPPAGSTQISIGDVTGLAAELALKLEQGSSFAISRAAVIDSFGQIDGASGTSSDCLHVDGSSGPCGSAGSTLSFSDHETPSGAMNGSNAVFSLMNAPSPMGSLNLFRNGVLLNPASDYVLSANVITFSANAIPQAADVLDASYRYGVNNAGVSFADGETPGGAVNGSNVTFTLAAPPNPASSLRLYRNGLAMKPGVDYNLSGVTVTFLSPSTPQSGDVLLAYYRD
jgi:hypothetical protein